MNNFTAHQLHFTCEVQTPILLNEHQGSAIRGALFYALRHQFCYNKEVKDCGECVVWATCPLCFLVATRNPQSGRGTDVPRPYVIEPPLPPLTPQSRGEGGRGVRYEPGEVFSFGLTIVARALDLFPYLVLGSKALERGGLGKKLRREDGRWRRGTFAIRKIGALNRLSGERQSVLRQGDAMVLVPELPVTNEQVLARAAQLPRDRITLMFKTPTRIIERSKLQHRPAFRPLIQRLHRRLRDLTREFTDAPCYNPFDPIQDTERSVRDRRVHDRFLVSTHSIRYRILKEVYFSRHRGGNLVSTHSIRYRILKGGQRRRSKVVLQVSTHSIRYRILKGPGGTMVETSWHGFNPFDPIQDTERLQIAILPLVYPGFNPFDPIQDTERWQCQRWPHYHTRRFPHPRGGEPQRVSVSLLALFCCFSNTLLAHSLRPISP